MNAFDVHIEYVQSKKLIKDKLYYFTAPYDANVSVQGHSGVLYPEEFTSGYYQSETWGEGSAFMSISTKGHKCFYTILLGGSHKLLTEVEYQSRTSARMKKVSGALLLQKPVVPSATKKQLHRKGFE